MLVYDPKDEIITKIREQSILDIQHYPRFEDQQNAIIRIAAEVLREKLDEIKRRQYGDLPNMVYFDECVDKIKKATMDIFLELDVPGVNYDVKNGIIYELICLLHKL